MNTITLVCRRKKCIREIIWDIISRTVAIIVSHPLEVVSLRMMAQFVGGENKYRYIQTTHELCIKHLFPDNILKFVIIFLRAVVCWDRCWKSTEKMEY